MDTKVYRINERDEEKIKEAAEVIKQGGLVVFPTETVYGLGANALDEVACKKIFQAKGRPQDNPLIVHVASFDISKYVKYIPDKAKILMENFWPGPLTIIMPKSSLIPDVVTAGLDSVAIRMPENKLARKLIEFSGVPIAAPSANISGRPSPTSIEHCIEDLYGRVDMIIGGERCRVGLESTVVDATDEDIIILRPGFITKEDLEEVVGKVFVDPAIKSEDFKPKSPGMKYRHYAPKAPLKVIKGDTQKVVEYIKENVYNMKRQGKTVGVLIVDEIMDKIDADIKVSLGSIKDPGTIAANLFDKLREFDKTNVDLILSIGFKEDGLFSAIMNRLKKASGNNLIEI
ncbi:L-threonylcarbamoyladenylate synthase [Caloramator australicus]|uniref:Threonylcarbamoyl-AMP synthase n=1 Tax=Caloramator australicus RC3 TaxID=857293 RepID=G0V4G8_9CLOT|nr:L-threonylcarbamoyladenylate synthase [Caloramator australicus]CCC58008.1 YrdC/Sua5 family protein, required for threonylcarbamoyladenosine (t(6)A) formation in tRNA [Caloramator australicus RC3]